MCKIRIIDDREPWGSAPRPIRRALCGIEVEAEPELPSGEAVVDFIPGGGGNDLPSYYVRTEDLSRVLGDLRRHNAATYYERLHYTGDRFTHVQINKEVCTELV